MDNIAYERIINHMKEMADNLTKNNQKILEAESQKEIDEALDGIKHDHKILHEKIIKRKKG